MGDFFAGWRFALRRLRAGWRFMMVASIGVIVAASLLAAAPIYASTMSDLGLQFRLSRGLDKTTDEVVYATVHRLAIGDPVDLARRAALVAVTKARLGQLAPEVLVEARTDRMDLSFASFEETAPEEPVVVAEGELVRQPWGAFLLWPSGFEEHVTVVDGRLPGEPGSQLEVVLPDGFQRHSAIGDVVRLDIEGHDDCQSIPLSDDPSIAANEVRCRQTLFTSSSISATIVGFVAADDPGDLRWQWAQLGSTAGDWTVPDAPLRPRIRPYNPADGTDVLTAEAVLGRGGMPLITTQSQFFGVFGRDVPELEARHRIGVIPDLNAIGLADVSRTIDDIEAWETDIGTRLDLLATTETELTKELGTFRNAQTFSQVPLLLILLQVVGIVLFYVMLVMHLLLERQSEEIGVYVGRGASTTQIVGLSAVEGLVMAIPAALAAPWIAQQAVRALGFTSTFESITGGVALQAAVTPAAFLLASGGALLALLAMLLPSLVVARRGIVDVKRDQARPAEQGLVQRYYLDFGIVMLAALLLWQLQQRGSVFDPDSVGGWSTDPILLLTPLVITLALAGLLLRFYPPLLRLAVRLLMLFHGTAVAIGLRRAGRAPASYARLMLLVVMAISVGTFAASYGPTVDRSFSERIHYDNGVDFRVDTVDSTYWLREEELEAVRSLEGVADAALVHRGVIATPSGVTVPLLAIDVERTREMMWFRDDFALEQPMSQLLNQLESAVPAGGGLLLPEDTISLEFFVRTEGELEGEARESIRPVYRDVNGNYAERSVTGTAGSGWVKVSGRLPGALQPPITLVSLRLADQVLSQLRIDGSLYFDDFTAVNAAGQRTLMESFEGEFHWTMYSAQGKSESFGVSTEFAHSGGNSAHWIWEKAVGRVERVLALNDPTVPVAALMNGPAMGAFGTGPGGIATAGVEGVLVPLSIRAQIEMFPTLDPELGMVIVNYQHWRSLVTAALHFELAAQNELWIDFDDATSIEEQQEIVASLLSGEAPIETVAARSPKLLSLRLEEVSSDPTLQASGSGILAVAFISVLALSTLGFIVTLVLSARSRTVEFAVLRIIGTSARQILRSMLLEWGTVVVIGAVVGILLGRQVARIMLSFLEVTDQGVQVLPPFILQTNWMTVGVGIGVLSGLVAIALGVAWATTMRRANASELRITQ